MAAEAATTPAGAAPATGGARACLFLMQLGGPATLDDIAPFLGELFADVLPLPGPLAGPLGRLIARRRTPKVRPLYAAMGGGSPILPQTQAQGEALAARLAERGLPCVFQVCMRYAPPRATAAVDWARAQAGHLPWIALSLYPQYSFATSRTGLRELAALMTAEERARLIGVCAYPASSKYLEALADQLTQCLAALPERTRAEAHVVFSAHGLPLSLVNQGDPYPQHIAQTVMGVLARTRPRPRAWTLSFQSRVGPTRWLEPDTAGTLSALGAAGVETVVVHPIAFVSEHIETLQELDVELAHIAAAAGVKTYRRVPTVGVHPRFIDGLADEVEIALTGRRLCCGQNALCERRAETPT